MTLLMNKWTNFVMDDGRVHPLAKTLPSPVNKLCWSSVMDDWNLDDKPLAKWQQLQHSKSIIPPNLQGMTNNVGLTFTVGDTTLWFSKHWARWLELVALNIIHSAVNMHTEEYDITLVVKTGDVCKKL